LHPVVGFGQEVKRTVTSDRRQLRARTHQSDPGLVKARTLLSTADDESRTTNLAFKPRAGNISTDTRAG
jgi:hypothetical protein